jgi:hypothetical protein
MTEADRPDPRPALFRSISRAILGSAWLGGGENTPEIGPDCFIAEAIEGGLTLNLSRNNPSHADAVADLDQAPAGTFLPNAVELAAKSRGCLCRCTGRSER